MTVTGLRPGAGGTPTRPGNSVPLSTPAPPPSAILVAAGCKFFDDALTGQGEPGGLIPVFPTDKVHPVVAGWGSNGG